MSKRTDVEGLQAKAEFEQRVPGTENFRIEDHHHGVSSRQMIEQEGILGHTNEETASEVDKDSRKGDVGRSDSFEPSA